MSTDISGIWVGIFVHLPTQLVVNLTLTSQNGSITGSYRITEPEDHPFPTGYLSGSMQDQSVSLNLTGNDPHGMSTFSGTLESSNGFLMMHGVVPFPNSAIPLGGLVVFRVADEDTLEETIRGAWTGLGFQTV